MTEWWPKTTVLDAGRTFSCEAKLLRQENILSHANRSWGHWFVLNVARKRAFGPMVRIEIVSYDRG